MKCVLILLDGLGDRFYEQLNHQTPLQAARTPVLDGLAKRGANGLYHASSVGLALPSENAHFAIFGYDMDEFPGRGALEALGAGIKLDAKDVAVLGHLACLAETDGALLLDAGTPKIAEKDASALMETVSEYEFEGVQIRFQQTKGLFGIVTLHGDVSPFITDSDPIRSGRTLSAVKPWRDHAHEKAAQKTASALEAYHLWVIEKLQKHPVNVQRSKEGLKPINGIVTQRAGRLKKVTPFRERYGLRGLSISSGIIYWGLSTYLGLDYKKVEDTENPGDDLAERLSMTREALSDYDFVHLHTKAPDQAAHTKDPIAKKTAIESLDAGIGRAIVPLLDDPETLIVVASDHSTPSSGPLVHSGETVPVIFCGPGVRRDKVMEYNEISAANGALGCIRGKELIYLVLNHLDRSKLQGLMDTPVDQLYWPGNYEPFQKIKNGQS